MGVTLARGSEILSYVVDVFDILVVAFLIYETIALVRQTHTAQLAKGIFVFLAAFLIADFLGMKTVRFLLTSVMNFGIIALVVMFQPELRRSLEQVGSSNIFGAQFFRPRIDPRDLRSRWKTAVVAICDAAENMAETHTGALMVLERRTNLSEVIKGGTPMHADVNSGVIGTIFYEGTPLHDGAMVVRDAQIEAAGCVLPLSNNLEIGKDMGTRHRAALGMSENSDAIIVVVSEETGIISMAKNGVLIRRLDRQNLYNLLEGDIVPPAEAEKKQSLWPFHKKKGTEADKK